MGTVSDGRLIIHASTNDGGATLALTGEVDPHTTDQLDAAVDDAIGGQLVLDLSGVSFIDSAGLRSLIRAQRLSESANGSLVLRAPQASTLRVLEITGLTDELTIEPQPEPVD